MVVEDGGFSLVKQQVNAIQQGVDAADRGEFASDERVREAFKKWGVTPEPR